MRWQRKRRLWLAALLLSLSGCVNETHEGDKTTFRFALWVPLAVTAAAIAATGIGAAVRKQNKRLGYVLLIGGPVALVAVAPGMFLDRVDIDPNELFVRTGFWFVPNEQRVDLRQVTQIEIVAEKRRTRRGTRTDYKLVFHRRDGGSQTVSAGDLLKQSLPKIESLANEQGIQIVDRTGT